MVQFSITTQPQTFQVIMSIAGILDFDTWISDVKKAYLTSNKLI